METDGDGASPWWLARLRPVCVEELGQENLCQGAETALGGGLSTSLSQCWAEHSYTAAGSGPSFTHAPVPQPFLTRDFSPPAATAALTNARGGAQASADSSGHSCELGKSRAKTSKHLGGKSGGWEEPGWFRASPRMKQPVARTAALLPIPSVPRTEAGPRWPSSCDCSRKDLPLHYGKCLQSKGRPLQLGMLPAPLHFTGTSCLSSYPWLAT